MNRRGSLMRMYLSAGAAATTSTGSTSACAGCGPGCGTCRPAGCGTCRGGGTGRRCCRPCCRSGSRPCRGRRRRGAACPGLGRTGRGLAPGRRPVGMQQRAEDAQRRRPSVRRPAAGRRRYSGTITPYRRPEQQRLQQGYLKAVGLHGVKARGVEVFHVDVIQFSFGHLERAVGILRQDHIVHVMDELILSIRVQIASDQIIHASPPFNPVVCLIFIPLPLPSAAPQPLLLASEVPQSYSAVPPCR